MRIKKIHLIYIPLWIFLCLVIWKSTVWEPLFRKRTVLTDVRVIIIIRGFAHICFADKIVARL